MRLFYLQRDEEESGGSVTNYAASGVECEDGVCVVLWVTGTPPATYYNTIEDLEKSLGLEGKTHFVWYEPCCQ